MKIYITKTEAQMLHDAIDELMHNVYENEASAEGSSSYSKRQIAAIENVSQKLVKAFG